LSYFAVSTTHPHLKHQCHCGIDAANTNTNMICGTARSSGSVCKEDSTASESRRSTNCSLIAPHAPPPLLWQPQPRPPANSAPQILEVVKWVVPQVANWRRIFRRKRGKRRDGSQRQRSRLGFHPPGNRWPCNEMREVRIDSKFRRERKSDAERNMGHKGNKTGG